MTTSLSAFDHALADRYRPEVGDIVETLVEHRNGHGVFAPGSLGIVTEILGAVNVHVASADGLGGWVSHQANRCVCREDASRLPAAGDSVVMLRDDRGLKAGEIADVVETRQSRGSLIDLVLVGRRTGLRRIVFAGRESVPLSRMGERHEVAATPPGTRIRMRYPIKRGSGKLIAAGALGTVEREVNAGPLLKAIEFDDGETAWVDPVLLAAV
jgi:hypothetical protein